MKQGTQELKDLEVDRVDGVDRPATGRNFLLFKSEDGKAQTQKAADDKGYGQVATAADAVLKAIRKDSKATVSRSSAVALNGLAQVLGQDAVFVGKSVPTQPYEITEPDADKRGPADEKLGSNFVARNAEMIGTVAFRMKDDEKMDDDAMYGTGKKKAADDKKDDEKPDFLKDALAKMAEGIGSLAKGQLTAEKIAEATVKALQKAAGAEAEGVSKSADDEPQPGRKGSRQVQADDEPVERVRVRKGDYEPRLGVSFADVAFGDRNKR